MQGPCAASQTPRSILQTLGQLDDLCCSLPQTRCPFRHRRASSISRSERLVPKGLLAGPQGPVSCSFFRALLRKLGPPSGPCELHHKSPRHFSQPRAAPQSPRHSPRHFLSLVSQPRFPKGLDTASNTIAVPSIRISKPRQATSSHVKPQPKLMRPSKPQPMRHNRAARLPPFPALALSEGSKTRKAFPSVRLSNPAGSKFVLPRLVGGKSVATQLHWAWNRILATLLRCVSSTHR
ncbi:hypothetical protein BGZ61DRAFT_191301 [Ilyonectria robusta]|uniref:uncharacterized protein n=1 Tax=Ilyonectria robusta TaxID=1079257 RepID=UPI001E8D850B|nr:uncharacterized protein BGZ61DRAFT_191301 [Ilyonectria robusta]KAH8656306.1 hypothetical protein BGZ61DRAFT_191301 [Ilyonectria robusta]